MTAQHKCSMIVYDIDEVYLIGEPLTAPLNLDLS